MKKLSIKVCGHYVLVKPEKFEEKSLGGIITATAKQAGREDAGAVRGHIVGIGPNAWKAFNQGEQDQGAGKPWAEIGNYVFFKRHVSDRIEDRNDIDELGRPQEYFLLNDENIQAIIEE